MHNPGVIDGASTTTLRPLRAALLACCLVASVIAALGVAGDTPIFQENGPAETAQLALWIGAALFAFILAIPQPRKADAAALALVGLAAAAAAAREVDAHVLLNPETIGEFGVRYRIDWWLDSSTPILKKLAWAAAGLALAAAVIGATVAAHFHPILALKQRNRAVVYFAAAGACIAIGFGFDDLLRGRIPLTIAQAAEESIETLAPLFYLAATNHLAASALVGSRAALHQAAADTLSA